MHSTAKPNCRSQNILSRQTINWSSQDKACMRLALRLAKKGLGLTSPNPMVGAVLVKDGVIIGTGWHKAAGLPHAEVEAINDAEAKGASTKGATLYVTLEPCSTFGRTPPCTDAIISGGISRVVVAAIDPNPLHAGRGFSILKNAGIKVESGLMSEEACVLNEAFNHWIVTHLPFVIVKAGMSADGKIATAAGESKWISSEIARYHSMRLRLAADAILVGVRTVLEDDPSLTLRLNNHINKPRPLKRIVLDTCARIDLNCKLLTDQFADLTTVVVGENAPHQNIRAIERKTNVLIAPTVNNQIDVVWLLKTLGNQDITCLLIEGGGTVNGTFLRQGLAQRIAFYFSPKLIGGENSPTGFDGPDIKSILDAIQLQNPIWKKIGNECFLTANVVYKK